MFFRIPSYFGTIPAAEAAKQILDGIRRNYAEFSVPGYLLYLGHIFRYLHHILIYLNIYINNINKILIFSGSFQKRYLLCCETY
jgi:hypothetical protein